MQDALTSFNILLVGENEEQAVLHLTIIDDAVKLLVSFHYAAAIGRVNNKDETLGACDVKNVSKMLHDRASEVA